MTLLPEAIEATKRFAAIFDEMSRRESGVYFDYKIDVHSYIAVFQFYNRDHRISVRKIVDLDELKQIEDNFEVTEFTTNLFDRAVKCIL